MTDPKGPPQFSLFGEGEGRLQAPQVRLTPDPETVRRRLHALLQTARSARAMPWSDDEAGHWRLVFPQMANWLPAEEAEQLRLAFAQEMERLATAA